MTRMLFLATGALPAAARVALAADETSHRDEKFDPSEEWTLHPWVSIHIGPIDMSINKAVAYLLLGAAGHDPARHRPDARARRGRARTASRRSAR